MIFAGTSTLTGPTDILSGTLQVDGSQPSSAVTDGEDGSTSAANLSGTGTVGPISATRYSTISPGDGATEPGILTADGDVTLNSASTLDVALNGTTAGTGYSQLNATGSVSLGGSTLSATLGFTPAAGESFTILKSTAPITGTFAGLPEGGSVEIGGVSFTINYAADGGDEVMLTPAIATPLATTTALSSSANPSTVGESVTFTATVAGPSGAGTPSGSVSFDEGATTLGSAALNASGQASFSTSTLAQGSGAITAVYTPTGNFVTSSSAPLTQTVNAVAVNAATTTTLRSSANPSLLGQSVTFTATVAGPTGAGTPSGSVSFEEGSTTLGSAALGASGQASFTTGALSLGSDTIIAVYAATGSFLASSSAPLTQVVSAVAVPAPTTTKAVSSVDPSVAGQSVVFTAIVAPANGAGTPTGTVIFTIDGKAGSPVSLTEANGEDQATVAMPDLAAGSYTISADYSGDSGFAPSNSSPITQVVSASATVPPPVTTSALDGPKITLVQAPRLSHDAHADRADLRPGARRSHGRGRQRLPHHRTRRPDHRRQEGGLRPGGPDGDTAPGGTDQHPPPLQADRRRH